MTREEYFKLHDELVAKMSSITQAKNADYTGASVDDPFANFAKVASLGICSPEQGFLVRMMDKMMRITSFVQKGVLQVKDESVEDTLLDLANYSLLMIGYIQSKRQEKALPIPPPSILQVKEIPVTQVITLEAAPGWKVEVNNEPTKRERAILTALGRKVE